MSRYHPTIHLDLEDEPYKLVEIHPVILFSILDQYIRRDNNDRVIGSLLGFFGNDGVVQVTNCFPVPHNEKPDQFALNMDFHKRMIGLHSTVSPHQQIVGWYSTAFNSASVLVHNFYAKEINRPPVHLLIDPTSLEKGILSVNCYYTISVHFVDKHKSMPASRKNPEDKKLQEHFRPIRYTLKSSHGERTVLERLIDTKETNTFSQLSNNIEALERALQSLLDMINVVSQYVKDVTKGIRPGDVKIGHLIEDTLALLPLYQSDSFEKIFTKGLQDVLMIVYLANLTRTHLLLAEQLRDQTNATTTTVAVSVDV